MKKTIKWIKKCDICLFNNNSQNIKCDKNRVKSMVFPKCTFFKNRKKCFRKNVLGNNCTNEVKYYRKLDENPREVCETHYNRMTPIEKRHYFKF